MEVENPVKRLSWWPGRMGFWSGGTSGNWKSSGIKDIFWRKDLITDHYLFSKGFSAPFSFLNSLFPPHQTLLLIHNSYIVPHYSHPHSSLPNYMPLDKARQQFAIIIFGHYWSGTVPKNLGGLIHSILTIIQDNKCYYHLHFMEEEYVARQI